MPHSFATRLSLTAALLGMACAMAPSTSTAASMAVQLACADDYYAYCGRHAPDSKLTRKCMRTNGTKLSQGCISALVAAGEITKNTGTRRASVRR